MPEHEPAIVRFRSAAPVLVPVLLAIALRGSAMLAGGGAFADPDNYLPLARSLARGEGLAWNGRPTAYRPPLYPVILAPLLMAGGSRTTAAIAVLHLALGAGTVWLTGLAARRWGLGNRRVLAAGAIAACDPVLVWQCRFVMTETLSAFLVALALAELARPGLRGLLGGGISLGMGALCRPSLIPGAGLIALGAMVAGPGTRRERTQRALILGILVAVVLAPWAMRNAMILGEPVWTTTHGGYTLALANNPPYYSDVLDGGAGRVWTGDDQWRWWDLVNRATAGMSEPQADRFLRDTVFQLAREQPGRFVHATLDRLARFWSLAPAGAVYSPAVRWATAIWTFPLWIALLLGLGRQGFWNWPRIAAPLAIAGLTVVHAFYWTDLRMRAPIMPAIALVASAGAPPFWCLSRSSFKRRPEGPETQPDRAGG